jgi:hypothetical protein
VADPNAALRSRFVALVTLQEKEFLQLPLNEIQLLRIRCAPQVVEGSAVIYVLVGTGFLAVSVLGYYRRNTSGRKVKKLV